MPGCQLTRPDCDDIDKDEFLDEKKRLQHFIVVLLFMVKQMSGKKLLKLLQFINKYNLANSVSNIVVGLMLRIFLAIAISVANCERGFL